MSHHRIKLIIFLFSFFVLSVVSICEGNYTTLAYAMSISDSEKPFIDENTINVNQTECTVGDIVTFSVKISDNEGISRANISLFNRTSNYLLSHIPLEFNENAEMYQCQIEINDSMPSGVWQIGVIYAYDYIDNYSNPFVYRDLFTVYGAGDSEQPNIDLDSIVVNQTECSVGDIVTFSVRITDNEGISRASISLFNRTSSCLLSNIPLEYNENVEIYQCQIEITDSMPSGVWQIGTAYAYDYIGNYSNPFVYKDLFTLNEAGDSEQPFIDLDSIFVSTTECTVGDEVTITIKISDNEGISRANISLFNETANNLITMIELNHKEEDTYQCKIEIDETFPDGIWQISGVYAYDYSDNFSILSPFIYAFSKNCFFDFSTTPVLRLPNSVQIIENESFCNTNASVIILPDSYLSIENRAFANSKNLRWVFIPRSVEIIADDAFYGCNSVIILGEKESYAEEYAIGHEMAFIPN